MLISKLQHIYDKHAGDFGLSGPKSPNSLQALKSAIDFHVSNPATKLILGKYRGHDANLYYSPLTQNVVVTDQNGDIVAAFKASQMQASYIASIGRLN